MTNQISTELVVDVAPGKLLSNTFPEFNTYWRGIMRSADIKPQTGDDVASIKKFEKQSIEVEKKVSEALRLAMTGNPEIQKLVTELEELQGDSRALRLKLGKLAASWLTDQKQAEVQKQVERISAESGRLFIGRISKAGREFCEIVPRIEGAGKGKKTLDTYAEAVSAEADLIISEMTETANSCNANLSAIDATDLPALFQDSEALMMLPVDQLSAEIGKRVAEYKLQEQKRKAQVQRNPEKLAELKAEASETKNIYHLNNWKIKYKQRIESELPHADDLAELWGYCGSLRAKLEEKEKERRNEPPPPIHEDIRPESGPAHAPPTGERGVEHAEKEEEQEVSPDTSRSGRWKGYDNPKDLSFVFRVTIPGTSQESKDKANKLAEDIWKLVGSRGCVAEQVND